VVGKGIVVFCKGYFRRLKGTGLQDLYANTWLSNSLRGPDLLPAPGLQYTAGIGCISVYQLCKLSSFNVVCTVIILTKLIA